MLFMSSVLTNYVKSYCLHITVSIMNAKIYAHPCNKNQVLSNPKSLEKAKQYHHLLSDFHSNNNCNNN